MRGLTPIAEAAAGVALWWCDLDQRAMRAQALACVLSPAEQARAARFATDTLRDRWIAGRTALRELLADMLGIAEADVPLRRGLRGRPEIAIDDAPDFNVSHTRGVAVIAIGAALDRDTRIGVDVERTDRDVGADRLARKFLSARECASIEQVNADERRVRFLRIWTYKEAMSKATADGLIAPFRALDIDCDGPRLLAGPAPYLPTRWRLFALDVGAAHFAALALWRSGAPAQAKETL